MTRKHFQQLADSLKYRLGVINHSNVGWDVYQQRAGWFQAVSAVVSVCEVNNPRFNRPKFYEACGIDVDNYPG